jgi:hypothetical protein
MNTQFPLASENPLPSCPRCRKQMLVKCANEDIYCCLNCSFRKDLNKNYWDGLSALALMFPLVVVVTIVFSLVSVGMSVSPNRKGLPIDENVQLQSPRTNKTTS